MRPGAESDFLYKNYHINYALRLHHCDCDPFGTILNLNYYYTTSRIRCLRFFSSPIHNETIFYLIRNVIPLCHRSTWLDSRFTFFFQIDAADERKLNPFHGL